MKWVEEDEYDSEDEEDGRWKTNICYKVVFQLEQEMIIDG